MHGAFNRKSGIIRIGGRRWKHALTFPDRPVLAFDFNIIPVLVRLDIEMVLATPLIRPPLILQPSTPILPSVVVVARIHHHDRYRATGVRPIVIRIRACRGQVKAAAAFPTAIGFAVVG